MSNLSKAQILYLNCIQKKKRFIRYFRILIFIFFIFQWELTTRIGLVDSFIFCSPSGILTCFLQMLFHEQLIFHIGITLFETLVSFLLVLVITLCMTTCLWLSDTTSKILEPYLVILNSLPKSAMAPLFIVWFGATYRTIIITGISVAIFGSVISLYTAFLKTDPDLEKLILTLHGNRKDIFTKIVLPSNIPIFLSLMKVNIGLCLVGVIIGEFISSKHGLGYLIIYGSQVFKLNWVIMSILILCFIACILYWAIGLIEKTLQKKRQ